MTIIQLVRLLVFVFAFILYSLWALVTSTQVIAIVAHKQRTQAREFPEFRREYARAGYTNVLLSDFLRWLIGFVEGDGCIIVSDGRPIFVLVQKEKAILDHIVSTLGFGTVVPHRTGKFLAYKLVVQNVKDIIVLTSLFNGNLALAHRRTQLGR